MKVIIIGAGLGGLVAAVTLAKKGHHIKIVERKDKLWTVGGAINLTSTAVSELVDLGMQEKLNAISETTEAALQRDLASGTVFRSFPMGKGRRAAARTSLRPPLLKLLYEEAIQLGAVVEFSSTVTDLTETTTAAFITLANGAREEADLILGADGVKSRMRPKVLGSFVSSLSELEPVVSDRVYYIIKFTPEEIQSLASEKELLNPNQLSFWAGREGRYVISLFHGVTKSLNVIYSVREPIEMKDMFDERGDISYVREKFIGQCHPQLQRALEVGKTCERWQLAQMPDLPRWRSTQGRIILIGDALHAMHPTAGQGFSSTVEEMSVLAYILEKRPGDVSEATRLWEEICKPRSNRLRGLAAFLSLQYEGDAEAIKLAGEGAAREEELRKTDPDLLNVKGDINAQFASPEYTAFALRYDPLKHAQEYLERHASNGVKVSA